MSIIDLCKALQYTGWATAFRESKLAYPITLSLHLTGMGLFGGMIAVTDMRLLGWAFRGSTITDIVKQLQNLKRFGLVLTAGCGILLFSAKAELYYHNPFFWTKITLLTVIAIHAFVFRRSVYGNTQELDSAPTLPQRAKLAAWLSLLLWLGVLSMGRSIAYYDVPDELAPDYGSVLPLNPDWKAVSFQ